jgi:signal transduction histidine kinase
MTISGLPGIVWVWALTAVVTVIFTATVIAVIAATQRKQVEQGRRFSRGLVDAQEAERARIARELHDDIIQRVALIGGLVSGLERVIPTPPEQVTQRIAGLREELDDLAEEIRAIARRAHPSVLEHLGLAKAVQSLANEFGVSDHLTVAVECPADSDLQGLNPNAALSLYRVAQEGLRNVSRHAGTDSARVELYREDAGVELVVSDRGRGLDLAAAPRQGLGLLGLGERLRAVQGRLTVESSPGRGTRLVAWVPMEGGRA